jgi:hypothetical protein
VDDAEAKVHVDLVRLPLALLDGVAAIPAWSNRVEMAKPDTTWWYLGR